MIVFITFTLELSSFLTLPKTVLKHFRKTAIANLQFLFIL